MNSKYAVGGADTYQQQFWKLITGGNNSLEKGKYRYLVRNKTDSLLNIPSKASQSNNDFYKGKENIAALNKIVDLCVRHNKKIYLIRSPQHAHYEGRSNEQFFQNILSTKFPNVEFLDFNDFQLSNADYGDLDHLNYKGARRFSIWFDKLLKDGLLAKINKQKFIEFKINEQNSVKHIVTP